MRKLITFFRKIFGLKNYHLPQSVQTVKLTSSAKDFVFRNNYFVERIGYGKGLSIVVSFRNFFGLTRCYYVGKNGDDKLDGLTMATKKKTLAAIENIIKPGDIVYVSLGEDV